MDTREELEEKPGVKSSYLDLQSSRVMPLIPYAAAQRLALMTGTGSGWLARLIVVETVRLARVKPLLPGTFEADNVAGIRAR